MRYGITELVLHAALFQYKLWQKKKEAVTINLKDIRISEKTSIHDTSINYLFIYEHQTEHWSAQSPLVPTVII